MFRLLLDRSMSLISWAVLLLGIGLLAISTTADRWIRWQDSTTARDIAAQRAEQAEAEAEQLERLIAAIDSDELVRADFVRRAWGTATSPDVELLALDDALRSSPTLKSQPVGPPTLLRSSPLETWVRSGLPAHSTTGTIAAVVCLIFGLLVTGWRKAPSWPGRAWSRLTARYRIDFAHPIPRPHSDAPDSPNLSAKSVVRSAELSKIEEETD